MAGGWGDWWKEKKKNNDEFLFAAERGDLEKLKKYLSPEKMMGMVADVAAKGLDNWTALHFAANGGHYHIIEELLKKSETDVNAESKIQRTPLHIASSNGHTNIVKALILKGADPNCKDEDESTPIHNASQYGFIDTLTFLLKDAKADTSIRNKFGQYASDISMNLETRQVFEANGGNHNASENLGISKSASHNAQYGRTAFNGVLRHNDRVNTV